MKLKVIDINNKEVSEESVTISKDADNPSAEYLFNDMFATTASRNCFYQK